MSDHPRDLIYLEIESACQRQERECPPIGHVSASDPQRLRRHLVESAARAIALVEAIDRRPL